MNFKSFIHFLINPLHDNFIKGTRMEKSCDYFIYWNMIALLLISGLILYFAYGVWNSRERQTSQYGEIVGYTGDASISCSTISKMEEEVVEPQPKRAEGEQVHIGAGVDGFWFNTFIFFYMTYKWAFFGTNVNNRWIIKWNALRTIISRCKVKKRSICKINKGDTYKN